MKIRFLLFCIFINVYFANGQQYLASNHITGTGDIIPECIISDDLQNTFISGYFRTPLIHSGQPESTKGNGDTDIFFACYNDDQEEIWFITIGGTGTDATTRLAFDIDGNVLIAGTYSVPTSPSPYACEFGSTDGNSITIVSPPNSDGRNAFLAKYNTKTGVVMWAKSIIAGTGTQSVSSLSVDSKGNILVGGYTAGAAAFPPSTDLVLKASTGYFVKFDSKADYLWHSSYASAGTVITGITSFNDSYVVAGYSQNTTTFTDVSGSEHLINPETTTGSKQYLVITSVDLDGNFKWMKNSDAPTNTTASQLTSDNDGTLFLSGLFSSTSLKYDGIPLGLNYMGSGSDIFVLSLDHNGELLKANSGGSLTTDYVYDIQVKNNLLYLAGNLGSSITLPGNRTLPAGIFVVAYSVSVDKTLTLIDALEGAKAYDAKGLVFSPKSFKLLGAFYTSPLIIGDSIFINPNTVTRDLYMSKACPIISITPTVTNVTGCDATAKNGSINLAVAGGADPYTYQWEKEGEGIIQGQTLPKIEGLDTGRYVATVLFNNRYCSKSANVTITAPGSLSITTLEVTHADCDQLPASTGSIKVNTTPAANATTQFQAIGRIPGNPTPVYSVTWTANGGNPNFNNFTFTNCPPGQYEVSVRNGDQTCPTSKSTAIAALESDGTMGITTQQYNCNLHNNSDTIGTVKATVSVDRTGKDVWFMLADAVTGATVQSTSQGKGTVTENGSICEFNKVLPGKYTVTTGEIGTPCMIQSENIDMVNPPVITISSVKAADVLCAGSATGRISVIAKGGHLTEDGKSTLKYELFTADDTPVDNDPDPRPTAVYFDNVAAGFYNIVVSDAAGCIDSVRNVEVEDQNDPITLIVDGLPHAACFGQNNGSAKLIASGGVHPNESTTYTYTLASSSNSYQNASGNFSKNLPAASYTATVMEQSTKCKFTLENQPIVVNSLQQLTFSDPAHENVKCKDGNSGTISVATITGGTGAYTASLSPVGGSVTEAPYRFENLYKGDYMVSVVDDYGCTAAASKQVVITEPATLVSLVVTGSSNVTCPGFLNGSITVEASGGTVTTQTPYAYEMYLGGELVAGPQPENVFSNIPAGAYSIKAIDANGCEAVASRNVTEPPASMTYTIAQADAKCFGSEDGSITITITSSTTGTLYYTLTDAKGNPIKDSSPIPSFSGLKAGTYRIQVYEGTNCGQLTEAIVIGQPEKLQIVSITTTPTSCRIPTDGTATVTISGGTGPYTYGYNATPKATDIAELSHTFTGLDKGTYQAYIIDANSCESGETDFTVAKTPDPSLTAAQSKLTGCNEKASIGVITATASAATGGSDAFQYKLGESGTLQTSTDFGNLPVGEYTVIVVDGNACQAKVEQVAVRVAHNPVVTATGSNIKCFNDKGSLTTSVDVETDLDGTLGSVISYQFDMNGAHFSDPGPSGDLTNLSPGEYTAHVVDSYSCQGDGSTTVAAPSALLNLSVSAPDVPTGSTKGTITAEPSGGWKQYTVTCYKVTLAGDEKIDEQTGDDTKSYIFADLVIGTYKIIVVDSEGCMVYKLQDVKMATGVDDFDANSLKIFPNPSSDGRFIIEWDTKEDRKVTLEVYNMSGQLVYKTNVQTGVGGARSSLDISKQSRGTYLLRVPELEIKQKLVVQ